MLQKSPIVRHFVAPFPGCMSKVSVINDVPLTKVQIQSKALVSGGQLRSVYVLDKSLDDIGSFELVVMVKSLLPDTVDWSSPVYLQVHTDVASADITVSQPFTENFGYLVPASAEQITVTIAVSGSTFLGLSATYQSI